VDPFQKNLNILKQKYKDFEKNYEAGELIVDIPEELTV